MASRPQTMLIVLSCIVTGIIVFAIFTYYSIYSKNVRNLNAYGASKIVKPNKMRFILAWFGYNFIPYVLAFLFIWLVEKEFPSHFAWILPLMMLSIAPLAYPYYALALYDGKINGATQWGWLWKRVEIRFNEIDKDKVVGQSFGRLLGITLIYSTSGVKLLTLGLSHKQLSEILESAKSANNE